MKWFKHFTDSHRGKSLKQIKRSLGVAGIGMYWCLVEACAEKMEKRRTEEFSPEHCKFEFDIDYLAVVLGTKSVRVEDILSTFQGCDQLSFSTDGFIIKIDMPKLLECLDRDTDRARPVRVQAAPKKKKENIEREREEEAECSHVQIAPMSQLLFPDLDFFNEIKLISHDLQSVWIKSYPEDYLKAEINKAKMWCIANPKKKPKATGPFLNNWFSRGWEQYRKSVPTNTKSNVFDFEVDEKPKESA